MKKIIELLAQRPSLVNIFIGLIVVIGAFTLLSIRNTFFPAEPVSFISVNVVYRGASPQEVEEEVINKVEDNLQGLEDILRVTSTATESNGNVRIELKEEAEVSEVLQDVNNAVDRITTFPDGIDTPVILKEEPLNYTMTVSLVGDVSRATLKDYAKYIKDELILSPGLSQITISGYPEEEIEVRVRESDLRAYELTFGEVSRAIQQTNLKASGGEVETEQRTTLIRLDSRDYYAKGLLNTVVKATPDGKAILLQDVAEVKNRFADKPDAAFVNGQTAVTMTIFSRFQEDILDNAAYVADYMQRFNDGHEGVEAIIVEDKSLSLTSTIGTLTNSAWQGVLLVLIVLGLFLHPRIAFWVAFKIPVALLGMFILSNFYGMTINQLSLFGTIVVLGILVDDGVVVAENIYQHYTDGKSRLQAAVDGTREVVPAIVSSLTTTALAFSLFFFLDGQLGDYFSDIAFVVCATLLIAILESLFFLPVHVARSKALSQDDKPWKLTRKTNESLIRFRDQVYAPIINFGVRRPWVPIVGVVVVMGLTVFAIGSGTIKSTFFPTIDQDVITARLELPLGTDETMVNQRLKQMEKAVTKVDEDYSQQRDDGGRVVNYVERIIGPRSNEGKLNIYLMEGDKRGIPSFEIAGAIRDEVGPIPEARNLSYGSVPVFGKPVSIALVGSDPEQLRAAKMQLRDYLERRRDLKDVTDTDKQGVPELAMQLSSKARYLGLTEAQVFNQIRQGFFGLEVQSLQRGDEEVKVWLRYDEQDRRSVDQLDNVRLRTPGGAAYPIRELATFADQTNVAAINHQEGTREIRVEADVENLLVSVPGVLAEAEATVLNDIQRQFPNLRYTLEGEARLSSKTQNSSQMPSIIILVLMITVLMLNYRSVSKTLAILVVLPFAFVGVAWGTFLHGIPFSIFSVLGMIALWGILINNSLVLISTYNEELKKGSSVANSLKSAAIARFRPIVLTTITTVFGLAPLLLNNSISAQFIKPTAIAVAYGLIFGTVLTLSFLPAVILSFHKLKELYYFKLRKKKVKSEELDVVFREMKHQIG